MQGSAPDDPTNASVTVPAATDAPAPSTFAERMMAKMGHVAGQGLGMQQQGIREPVAPEGNMQRTGLGFADHKFAVGLEDAPFFLADFDDVLTLPDSERGCDPATEGWPVTVAHALQSVSLSKFCRHEIKQRVTTQRRVELVAVLEQLALAAAGGPSTLPCATLMVEFPCVALDAALASRFPHARRGEVVTMAVLDERCELGLRSMGSSLVALDFRGSRSGFAAYVRAQCPGAAVTVVDRAEETAAQEDAVPTLDTADSAPAAAPPGPAPVHASTHNAMLTGADVDKCTAFCMDSMSGPPTLVVLDGAVDATTEVAGLGNAHVERWRKHTLLAQLRTALAVLAKGGALVAVIGDTFTRFTASLLYILGVVFTDLRIVKPFTLAPWTCDRMVVARGFQGPSGPLAQHLAAVHAKLDEAEIGADQFVEHDVLTFVPIPRLLSPAFFRFLCRTTERYAQRETTAVTLLAGELAGRPSPTAAAVAEAQEMALSVLPLLEAVPVKAHSEHGAP